MAKPMPVRVTNRSDVNSTKGVEVVYYVKLSSTRIKIGTTANLLLRCRQLVPGAGRAAVLAYEYGGRSLERERHQQFSHLRIGKTEQFRTGRDLMDHIRSMREALTGCD